MGWSGWPATATTDVQAYPWIIQAWDALRLRHRAMGQQFWPPPDDAQAAGDSGIWATGETGTATISGSDLLVTLPLTGSFAAAAFHSSPRFVDYTCTGSTSQCCESKGVPRFYDLIIEVAPDDPTAVVRCPITAQTDDGTTVTLTLAAANALNAETARWIEGISDLESKPYYIVGRGRTWWSDRWPDVPNDQEAWIGSDSTFVTILEDTSKTWAGLVGKTLKVGTNSYPILDNSATQLVIAGLTTALSGTYQLLDGATVLDSGTIGNCYSGIYQLVVPWPPDKLADLDLLIYAGALLQRLSIVGNQAKWLTVAQQGASIDGVYSIVAAGNAGIPGRKTWKPFQWYSGSADGAKAHTADDTIGQANTPQTSYTYSSGNDCTPSGECADFTASVFDNDFQVQFGELCSASLMGMYLNKNLYKSLRGIQNDITTICGSFVPMQSYDGAGAINLFTPASLFAKIGVNSGTSTTDYDGSNIFFPVTQSEYWGKNVYYEVFDANGKTKGSGVGAVTSEGKVIGPDNCGYTDEDHNDTGLAVVYSAGWTRWRPRWFKYLYPKTGFIPDVGPVTDGGDPVAIDPPQVAPDPETGHYDCGGKGTWITRGPSSGGVVTHQGFPYDSAEDFNEGEVYRYTGDNFRDPFPSGFPAGDTGTHNLYLPYEDRFYRGNLSPDHQRQRDGSRSGTVSAGTKSSFRQTDHDWGSDWANGGTLRTESGTATGGSATSLTDSSKDTTDPLLPWSCWYAPDRFATGDDPYVGFILHVDKPHAGSDLAVDATDGTKVTSAGYSFTPNDVGMTLNISSATGWTPGPYTVVAVDGGAAWLESAPAPAGTTAHAAWNMTTVFKRPITSCTTGVGGVTFGFNALDGFSVMAGDTWKIDEPKYELNKWQGRQVVVTAPDGTKSDPITILYSDKDTLFFADQAAAIAAGSSFQILEFHTGGVYKWDGANMVVATGADVVRPSVTIPADFKKDPTLNNEGWVKDYGAVEFGDMIQLTIFNEIYAALNELRWTKFAPGWTSRADPDTPENNSQDLSAGPLTFGEDSNDNWDSFFQSSLADAQNFANTGDYDAPTESSTSAPYASPAPRMVAQLSCYFAVGPTFSGAPDGDGYYDANAIAAYGYLSGVPSILPSAVDLYVFTGINEVDVAPQNTRTTDGGGAVSLTHYNFDATGQPVAYHQWKKFDTLAASTDSERRGTTKLGAVPPTWPHVDTPTETENVYIINGWCTLDQVAILKWDMGGY